MKKNVKSKQLNKMPKTVFVLYFFIAIFIVYGLAEIIYSIVNNGASAVFDIIYTIIIGGIFCIIFLFSASGTWGKFFGKSKGKEANEFDDTVNKIQSNKKAHIDFNLKSFLFGLCIFIVFGGLGIGVVCWGSSELKKITGENYVRTTAVIEKVEVKNDSTNQNSNKNKTTYNLYYAYFDEAGNKYYSTDGVGWGDINFKEGNKVTIYYNKENPKKIATLSTPVLLILGGSFFIAVSFLFLLIKLGIGNDIKTNKLVTFFLGSIFAGFGITFYVAVYLASGGSFFSLMLNGAIMYAMGLFIIVGLLFAIYAAIDTIKNIVTKRKRTN